MLGVTRLLQQARDFVDYLPNIPPPRTLAPTSSPSLAFSAAAIEAVLSPVFVEVCGGGVTCMHAHFFEGKGGSESDYRT